MNRIPSAPPARQCPGVPLGAAALLAMSLALAGATLGCKSGHEEPKVRPAGPPEVRALGATRGRVESVNERLHFVVLECALNPVPGPGSRLQVLREGRVVGELKVTGPSQGTRTAADIVSGEVVPGDDTVAE